MVTIREALREDMPVVLNMLQSSAADQGFSDSIAVTSDDLVQDGFGPQPRFHVLLAEANAEPAGMALYFFNYSTWTSRNGLYLEDLYVAPPYRKQGVARALMTRLAQIAVAHSCGRFSWVVHAENARAIHLYKSLGATLLEDWRLMSLKGSEIRGLAEPAGLLK